MNVQSNENSGMRLLKKGKKSFFKIVFSRAVIVTLLLLFNAFLIFAAFFWFYSKVSPFILGGSVLLSVIGIILVINSDMDPTARITWLLLMMTIPVFGQGLFFLTKLDFGHRAVKDAYAKIINMTKDALTQDECVWDKAYSVSPEMISVAEYLNRSGCFPIYDNTNVEYFPLGENKFKKLTEELEKANKFIFLEYFIIEEGYMWGKILEILDKKVKEGVEVRLMYDGTCEFVLLPHDYIKRLEKLGIKCKVFSPVTPFVSTHYNYRDHRKIVVIDGKVAFTGGINLADEYINKIEKHGHWKDTAVMVQGKAAESFALMFLQMWNLEVKKPQFDEFYLNQPSEDNCNANGYVIPFGDCPLDDDRTGEMIYMDILNRANKYVHIMSPYLILDGELETALIFAAKKGIDVKLILPGIPDKKLPYYLAKTHYHSLIEAGVKIYEYIPGFVHAKCFVSDDVKAVVGTINLDYRSLYHHFECAIYIYGCDCIADIENDFQNTLKKCREVSMKDVKKRKWYVKLTGALIKVFAPLM